MPTLDTYKLENDSIQSLEEKLDLVDKACQKTGAELDTQFKSAVEALDNAKLAGLLDKQFKEGDAYKSVDAMQSDDTYTFLVQTSLDAISQDERYENLLRGKDDQYGVDNNYGSRTRAAVRQFQTDACFDEKDIDGIVGPKTMEALVQALNGKLPLDFKAPIVGEPELYDIKKNTEATAVFPSKTEAEISTWDHSATIVKTLDGVASIWKWEFKDGKLINGNVFDVNGKSIAEYKDGIEVKAKDIVIETNSSAPTVESEPAISKFSTEDIKNTSEEESYKLDSVRQWMTFMNFREAQHNWFVNDKWELINSDIYERVEPESNLNYAVKEKPLSTYLKNHWWEKVANADKRRVDIVNYSKDVNWDGIVDVVPTKIALFIEKNKVVFDPTVKMEFYPSGQNSSTMNIDGGLKSFGIDLTKNKNLSISKLNIYDPSRVVSSIKTIDYLEMKAWKMTGLKTDSIVEKVIPDSLAFLWSKKSQILLWNKKNIQYVWDYTDNKKVAIPKDRENYVYENGKLSRIDATTETKDLYNILKNILSSWDHSFDKILQEQRGNLEIVKKDNKVWLKSFWYETYVVQDGNSYYLEWITNKNFVFTNTKELLQSLNLINRLKNNYVFNKDHINHPIVFDRDEIQLEDSLYNDTTIVSTETLKLKFPTIYKNANQFIAYINQKSA